MLAAPAPAGAAAAPGDIRITEWAYNGIEFFELTNVGRGAEDLTGWSYSDNHRTAAPSATALDLSAFGRVAPGESVIVSELPAPAFRAAWGLSDAVKVIGGNSVNLGGSDEVNVYDEDGVLVDRLTYGGATGSPTTSDSSAWVPQAELGTNTASAWVKSTAADAEGSWESTTAGFFGSPGTSTLGGYDAALNNSPDGLMRITEWEYDGSEYFELTNVGSVPQDMTGWSYSDSTRTPAPATASLDLSGFGTVAAGESVVVADVSAPDFRTAWGLDASVKVIGGNGVNLGRSDEINIYDADDALVDRLTYNDAGTGDVKGPRNNDSSAWVSAPALGANRASGWTKSSLGDAEGSWKHATLALYGSPGVSNFGTQQSPPEPPAETIKINEVESNGDVVGDWVELTNIGDSAVDVSGWTLEDAGDNPAVTIPNGTTIAPGAFYAIYTEIPGPGFGLGVDDTVTLYRDTTAVDSYSWSGGHAATTYGRCPDGTGEFRVTTVATRGAANACSPIRVNEVVTSGAPDQVEIVNLSSSPVDIAGWVVKDGTDVSPTTLPSPSVVPANGYLVVPTSATLDAADSVRLFDNTSALIDSATWTSDPTPSLGRCADGVGAFKVTEAATVGAANQCPGVVTEAWPGSPTVTVSDDAATFAQDASGLAFDRTEANTLWVAQNKLGTLWKMTKSGSTWVPASGWSKTPKYNDGSGAPDSEGITVGPDGAVYLATERDNSNSGASKNRVLRYDANAATGSTVNATDEWDINPLLPTLGANLGLEGITWVPDSFLVAGGFVDDSTDAAYQPSHYPAHGTGLYVVAVEGTGLLYVLALDQTAAVQETAHLVATVDPRLLTNAGPAGVMDVSYDPELGRLWAVCDDSCNGTTVQMKLDDGVFVVDHAYDRPAGMPNLNNEGFALAPQSTCVAGKKEVVWSDDGDTDTHSLRSGTFPCHSLASASGTPGSGAGPARRPTTQPGRRSRPPAPGAAGRAASRCR
ncbi:lamin tail domain-containing protein [Nocardioides hankookensis]